MKKRFMGIFLGILMENSLLFATQGCSIQNIIQKSTQSENTVAANHYIIDLLNRIPTKNEIKMVKNFIQKAPSSASTIIQPTAEQTSFSVSTTLSIEESISSTEMETVHSHTWEAMISTVHHDAITKQIWKEDVAGWDETVETKMMWDEQVLTQDAWDETVLLQDEYDEPVYKWLPVCNVCNYQFPTGTTADQLEYHIFDDPGCGGGWHDIQVQTGSIHHDAVYQVVHHDAIYQTIHHEAETSAIHHDAIGHYETVVTQDAWDETVVTGYQCSACGVTK